MMNSFLHKLSRLAGQSLLVVGLMLSMPVAIAEEGETPAQHQLSFKDPQGKDINLQDFVGKNNWLVVMIWQSDCHVCNQEAGSYDAWYQERKKDGIRLLGISTDGWDNKEAAQDFINRHKVTFPNAIVEYENLDNYYVANIGKNFFGTPTFLIFSPKGEILAEQAGAVPANLIDNFIKENSQQAQVADGAKTEG